MKQKKNKKFDNIVITATDLFKKFGMKRVSIEEICSKGNVSKATFYKHFPNKNELIKYIFNTWFTEGYDEFDKIESTDIPFPEKIKAILQIKRKFASNMSPEFIEEYVNMSNDLLPYFTELKQRSFGRFMQYLKKWQEEGYIRKSIKPEFIIQALESLEYFTKEESLPTLYDDYMKFVEEILNFFFYGILSERMDDET